MSNLDFVNMNVAVIDDDVTILEYLREFLTTLGLKVDVFKSAELALESMGELTTAKSIPEFKYDLILADVHLPGISGIELLKKLKKKVSDVLLILISAHINTKEAVQGIKEGAYDYVEKPFDPDRLEIIIRNSLRLKVAQRASQANNSPIQLGGVHCPSPSMRIIYELIRRTAPTDSNVLISGESGVGKELVAKAIHENSLRSRSAFVSINCSAIPENLLESELFGHAKGSFTGAHQARPGLFAEANRGTLFLDEIGDLNPLLQVKLLRAIQEKQVRPVGSNQYVSTDVRIISATNLNLANAVKEGKFREDLYYRLNVIPIHVPPLRQRKEDVLLLAEYFLKLNCDKLAVPLKTFSNQALEKLLSLRFRGNVRELQNIIERSVIFSIGNTINEWDIPVPDETEGLLVELTQDLPKLDELERLYVKSILEQHKGDKQAVAKILGVSKRTLYRKLEEAPRVVV
jgi:two-component system response regulator PilR (NtrC family)